MKPRIPWEAAPPWLREDRAEELLRTHRPAPSAEKEWRARLRALEVAKRDLDDGHVREKVAAEMAAMFLDRDRWLQQQDVAYRRYQTEDEAKALWCEMRAVDVRGMTTAQCGAKKICFLDGSPLPPRRQHWCSDECVERWMTNHEWSSASAEVLRRDDMTCQRCGYRSTYECQGTHLDAKGRILRDERPWPCPDHPHSGYRRAVASAAEPGVCGRDGEAWPCGAIVRASTDSLTGHWRVARPRGMEVNHKVPRAGRGYQQGCHHHLADLELLCHPCHVIVTTEQIRERKGIRVVPAASPSPAIWDDNDRMVGG